MNTVIEDTQVNKKVVRVRTRTTFNTNPADGTTSVVANYVDITYLDDQPVLTVDAPAVEIDHETLLAHMPSFPALQEAFDGMIAALKP